MECQECRVSLMWKGLLPESQEWSTGQSWGLFSTRGPHAMFDVSLLLGDRCGVGVGQLLLQAAGKESSSFQSTLILVLEAERPVKTFSFSSPPGSFLLVRGLRKSLPSNLSPEALCESLGACVSSLLPSC